MELTIWKYELETVDVQKFQMPEKAEILTVQVQKGVPCLYVLVNPNFVVEKEERTIVIYGTGHQIPQTGNRKYIVTYQLLDVSFVGHVFELIK